MPRARLKMLIKVTNLFLKLKIVSILYIAKKTAEEENKATLLAQASEFAKEREEVSEISLFTKCIV